MRYPYSRGTAIVITEAMTEVDASIFEILCPVQAISWELVDYVYIMFVSVTYGNGETCIPKAESSCSQLFTSEATGQNFSRVKLFCDWGYIVSWRRSPQIRSVAQVSKQVGPMPRLKSRLRVQVMLTQQSRITKRARKHVTSDIHAQHLMPDLRALDKATAMSQTAEASTEAAEPAPEGVAALKQAKQPPPETNESRWTRRSVLISFWVVALFFGLPVWWKTTTVYRAPLPLQEMTDWADGKVWDLRRAKLNVSTGR